MEKVKKSTKKFIGSWQLMEWTAELDNGEIVFPFGEDAKGRITYDKDGYMSVQIMKNRRHLFQSEDPLQAQPEEITEAYNGFIAYCGLYEVNPDMHQILHHIEISSFPNWVGQHQLRHYEFTEDKLILKSDFIGKSRHKLIWKK